MDDRQAAIYFLDREAYGRAEYHLQRWVRTHPVDTYAHTKLVECFDRRSNAIYRWKECDAFYQRCLLGSQQPAVSHLVKAEQLFREGKEQCLLEYKAALREGFEEATVRCNLAIALLRFGQQETAGREFEAALAIDPDWLPALYAYATSLFAECRFGSAYKVASRFSRHSLELECPRFSDAANMTACLRELRETLKIFRRVLRLWREGNVAKAAALLWPLFRDEKENCAFIRTLIYLFYRAGWLKDGERGLLHELRHKSGARHYAKGLFLWYRDELEGALKEYSSAIDRKLDHSLVYCARALANRGLKRMREAQDDAEQALRQQPWLACARERRALIAFEAQDFETVLQMAKMSAQARRAAEAYDITGREDVDSLDELALRALLAQGAVAEARRRAVRPSGRERSVGLVVAKAVVLAECNENAAAAEQFAAAVRADARAAARVAEDDRLTVESVVEYTSESHDVRLLHALLLSRRERFDAAHGQLCELSMHKPNDPLVLYHIAKVRMSLEDYQGAAEACKQSVALDPGRHEAVELLCVLLHNQEDLGSLLRLSDEVPERVLPLTYALDLALTGKDERLAVSVARKILEHDPGKGFAVRCVLRETEEGSIARAQLLGRYAQSEPFNFELRSSVALDYLCLGRPDLSADMYIALLAEGGDALRCACLAGLSFLASERTQNQSTS